MGKNKAIEALNKIGQSIWYDNLSRDVLQSGELKGLIDQGVSGLTSNPTIFDQAISGSAFYDADLKNLAAKKLSVAEMCEELMVSDVAAAADLLRPIFDAAKGADGHASIEVSPLLAHDTKNTVVEAQRIWGKLKRPNIMIKVPATKEGIPAIRTLLEEGLNVNITLIFSVEVYREVINAYISALEARVKAGKEVSHIASVASFFVSRVDAICEKTFDEQIKATKATQADKDKCFGKIGIANSKLAYALYEEQFGSDRFKALKAKGARIQRPLWASTGTKNPTLSPVLYLEELAGRDTVNTVPPKTLKALLAGANIEPRLHSGLNEAKTLISSLAASGLSFEKLLFELQVAGVKSFADSYHSLIGSIEKKVKALS